MPLLVAHGGTLLVLAGALGVRLEPAMRANAMPLLFRRAGAAWEAVALVTP
jgi:probable phosphoglycerate mutase